MRECNAEEDAARKKLRIVADDFDRVVANGENASIKAALRDVIRRLAVQTYKEEESLLYRRVEVFGSGPGIVFKVQQAGFTPPDASELYEVLTVTKVTVLLDNDDIVLLTEDEFTVIADFNALADKRAFRVYWAEAQRQIVIETPPTSPAAAPTPTTTGDIPTGAPTETDIIIGSGSDDDDDEDDAEDESEDDEDESEED